MARKRHSDEDVLKLLREIGCRLVPDDYDATMAVSLGENTIQAVMNANSKEFDRTVDKIGALLQRYDGSEIA